MMFKYNRGKLNAGKYKVDNNRLNKVLYHM